MVFYLTANSCKYKCNEKTKYERERNSGGRVLEKSSNSLVKTGEAGGRQGGKHETNYSGKDGKTAKSSMRMKT